MEELDSQESDGNDDSEREEGLGSWEEYLVVNRDTWESMDSQKSDGKDKLEGVSWISSFVAVAITLALVL
ncbi:hypothetical protein V8E54_014693 [Elaphomyces granulatus]|jgi:hypothetical protein